MRWQHRVVETYPAAIWANYQAWATTAWSTWTPSACR